MSDRVPMPRRVTFATDDVVAAASRGPDYGVRFSLTVAEDALHKLAPAVLPHIVERLAGQIAHEQRGAVERSVHEFLRDRTWAEPIIREAIRDSVREIIRDMLGNTALGDMLKSEAPRGD